MAESIEEFFEKANDNSFSALKHLSNTNVLRLARHVQQKFWEFSEVEHSWKDLMLPFFIRRCHASFLGSIRLASSGQTPEAYAVMRSCLEISLYALFIHDDTDITVDNGVEMPRRCFVWLNRGHNAETKSECRKLFTMKNVKPTLEDRDEPLCRIVDELYNRTIDNGSHPNFNAIVSGATISANGGEMQFLIPPDTVVYRMCFQSLVETGVSCLRIFWLMIQKYFDTDIMSGILNEYEITFPKRHAGEK